jgi:hypothetical protein
VLRKNNTGFDIKSELWYNTPYTEKTRENIMLKVDKFNVRVVFRGEGYGVNDVIIHDDETPLVEFYDSRHTRINPRGQFVSRYYASTLLEGKNRGLALDGGVPEWTVSAKDMETVRAQVISVL